MTGGVPTTIGKVVTRCRTVHYRTFSPNKGLRGLPREHTRIMSFTLSNGKQFNPSGLTKLALLMASMMVLMGSSAVSPALHGIEVELETSKYLASMVISLPSLVVAICGFPMGYLADRVGLAKTLIASLVLFIVSGVLGYFCTDIYTLLATRVFLGIGIAGISTAATGLMGIYYDGDERMRVMAIQSAFMGFGGVVLEIIGGLMADVAWNVPFLVYLIALPILIAGLIAVRDVIMPGNRGGSSGEFAEGSKANMAVLYASIFMLMFLMFIVTVNVSDILTSMGESMTVCGLVLALMGLDILTSMGESMTVCGLVLALMGLTQVFTSIAYSRLRRIPRYQYVLMAAFVLQAVGIVLFASDDLVILSVGVGIMGVGLGIGMPTITNNLAMMSPASAQGKTMGIYSCLMNLGTSLSAVVMGPIIVAIGYTASFELAAVAILVFGIVVLATSRILRQPAPATESE